MTAKHITHAAELAAGGAFETASPNPYAIAATMSRRYGMAFQGYRRDGRSYIMLAKFPVPPETPRAPTVRVSEYPNSRRSNVAGYIREAARLSAGMLVRVYGDPYAIAQAWSEARGCAYVGVKFGRKRYVCFAEFLGRHRANWRLKSEPQPSPNSPAGLASCRRKRGPPVPSYVFERDNMMPGDALKVGGDPYVLAGLWTRGTRVFKGEIRAGVAMVRRLR